jgi:hypothetical protein
MCKLDHIIPDADPCIKDIGGSKDELYYAALFEIDSIPDRPTNNTNWNDDNVIVALPIVFKPGKGFKKIQAVKNSVKTNYKSVGSGGSMNADLKFEIQGKADSGRSLNNIADNTTPYVFLVQRNNKPKGVYDLIGTFDNQATMKGEYEGGASDGERGVYKFEAMATQGYEVMYKQTITIQP